jgi:hypothetical protein
MLLGYEDKASRLRQCLESPNILPYHSPALQHYEEMMCIKVSNRLGCNYASLFRTAPSSLLSIGALKRSS